MKKIPLNGGNVAKALSNLVNRTGEELLAAGLTYPKASVGGAGIRSNRPNIVELVVNLDLDGANDDEIGAARAAAIAAVRASGIDSAVSIEIRPTMMSNKRPIFDAAR